MSLKLQGKVNIFPSVLWPCHHSSHWGQLSLGSHKVLTCGSHLINNSSDSLAVPPSVFEDIREDPLRDLGAFSGA